MDDHLATLGRRRRELLVDAQALLDEAVDYAKDLAAGGELRVKPAAEALGVHRHTLYKLIGADRSAGWDDCIVPVEGAPLGGGYVYAGGKGERYAHRRAWEDERGPIPEGAILDHRCRNRACINLDHLRLYESQSAHAAAHHAERREARTKVDT